MPTDEEIFESNKRLLELMTHAYDEEERRNALVDSKNSQMIILTGAMVTLQSTVVSQVLINTVFLNSDITVGYWCKIVLSIFLLLSISGYFISMYKFIKAYSFKGNFQLAPDNKSIIETIDENVLESDIVLDMLYVYDESIEDNDNMVNYKIDKGQEGFLFLKMSIFLTLILLALFILILLSYPISV